MSGFPSRAAPASPPVPIGGCVPLTRTTNDPAFLPVGSLIARARYPRLSAKYPRISGVSVVSVTQLPARDYRFSATDGSRVIISTGDNTPGRYSDDGGFTWADVSFPSGSYWSSIRYGNGVWVMVRPAASQSAYSANGLAWSTASMPSYGMWYRLAFGDGWFVSATFDSASIARTQDGQTWTTATLPSSGEWGPLAFGDWNGRFVILKYNSSDFAYSDDAGATWTAGTLPTSGAWGMLSAGNGRFTTVAVGSNVSLSSPDGVTWTAGTLPSSQTWINPLDTGGGYDFAYTEGNAFCAISPDGINWTSASLPVHGTPVRTRCGIYFGGRYLIPARVVEKLDLVVPDGPGATEMLLGGPAGYHVRVR